MNPESHQHALMLIECYEAQIVQESIWSVNTETRRILKDTVSCAVFTGHNMHWLSCGSVSLNTRGSVGLRSNTGA